MTKLFLTIIIAGACTLLQAQTRIENVEFKQDGNNIIVTYDLYSIVNIDAQLFYTIDNGVSWHGPLNSLTGDINDIQQGTNKSITWNVLKDQNWLISDNIQFKVVEEPRKGTFTDSRDNKTYKWIKIGKQKWMAENLAYKPKSGNYWAYNNIKSYITKYGYLYDWETACNVCPTGWHLPSDAEWTKLTNFLGNNSGTKLKAKDGWSNNGNGTDDYGFSALPGGARDYGGRFINVGNKGYWWCPNESNLSCAWGRAIRYDNSGVGRGSNDKHWGFSVRCIKD